ncbi:MAG TPA: SGNH/GDSL hydrolase family protein [Burkholderiales bacterium]|nr:SGNH/GDSL hydrolase family protein [Burkholderiales bacterium]
MQPFNLTTQPYSNESAPVSQRGFERLAAWVLMWMLACGEFLGAAPAMALPFSQLFVFGDSLSDSGNNAIFFDSVFAPAHPRTPTPIPDNSFFPSLPLHPFPYLSGRYTNDRVWAEYFGLSLGLGVAPSLAGGTDFAFGGAPTGPLGSTLPPSLRDQVAGFLSATLNQAPSDALYVLAGGGNNAADALSAILAGADIATTIQATALGYASDIAATVANLRAAGADDIIVWNTPDAGVTPAAEAAGPLVSAFATAIATAMNAALLAAVSGTPGVRFFDVFDLFQDVAANPAAFGLANADDACAQFVNCNPADFFFWDGIHPTSAGHQILAQAMLSVVPEPGSLFLLLAGVGGLVIARKRSTAG